MLKHVVFMKFKEGISDAAVADLQASLAGLPSAISEIRGFQFGRDVLHSERSYDFSLVADFDDLDAMKRYQVHPAHVAVLGKVRQICDATVVVDFNF